MSIRLSALKSFLVIDRPPSLTLNPKFRLQHPRKYFGYFVGLARRWIYSDGAGVASAPVERLLKSTSSVPTVNAFVDRLGDNFDIQSMLVVDFMHEFELGVWKALFTHLIRILNAAESLERPALVSELDRRYRLVPSFGSTIRRISNNASGMKSLAARDFEDLLQCSIPVFEGLLDEPFNSQLMTLLYRTAEWHGFAKLRMHTDTTLDHLETVTEQLGQLMRKFEKDTSAHFNTYELPKETEARNRRTQGKTAPTTSTSGRKAKLLNLFIYKWHSFGDYVRSIRLFGTVDGFSTQIGELAHRLAKRLYGLTNKKNAPKQIGTRVRRVEKARLALDRRQQRAKLNREERRLSVSLRMGQEETLQAGDDPDLRYYISPSRNKSIDIGGILKLKSGDPAYRRFLPKLKEHLLGRLLHRTFDGDAHSDFTPEECDSVHIFGGKLFRVQTCRVYYTADDVRRECDTINPATRPFVMVRAPPNVPETYWYAQVLGVYHAKVSTSHTGVEDGEDVRRMEFLWVRWLGEEQRYKSGFAEARLPKIGFVPSDDEYAFGFLDPANVIRTCHLIPAFHNGRTASLLPAIPTDARQSGENHDWTNFYVNVFVDRDMVIRQFGGGVGHLRNAPVCEPSAENGDSGMDEDGESQSESGSDFGAPVLPAPVDVQLSTTGASVELDEGHSDSFDAGDDDVDDLEQPDTESSEDSFNEESDGYGSM